MSFTFGAKTTAPPAFGTPTATFGQAPAQTGFSFGSTATPNAAPAPSLFGTPSSQTQTGFNFGTPAASTPGFGATATSTPAFGAAATSTPAFGAPAAAPAFGAPATAPAFGATTGFGAATPAAPTFGAPAAAAPAFGAPATCAPSFGLSTATATPSFGLQTSTTTPSLFGTPATTAATGLFGLSNTSAATAAQPAGFSFGATSTALPTASVAPTLQPAAPATGFTLGAPASTAAPTGGLTFGAPAASSAAPTLGSFGITSTAATTAKPTFGFTTLTPASAPSTTGFSLGGLGGTSKTTATTTTITTAPTVVGLGGIATTESKSGAKECAKKEVSPKDQPLPNEILQTVENFKTVIKDQKSYSSDIARCSLRDYCKVEKEIETLNTVLQEVEAQLQRNRNLTERLKYDTAKCLQNVDMAQRTQDTPPGLQYENTAPVKYFIELADSFEREMMSLKTQIESAGQYVKNCDGEQDITNQDITLGMKRLHETFVALAGRLQSVHGQVESQKESYYNLRRHVYNDTTNPFSKLNVTNDEHKNIVVRSPPKVATGPTPFSNLSLGGNGISAITAQQQAQNASLMGAKPPTTTTFGLPGFGGGAAGTQPSNTSLFATKATVRE
ncbi:nuclear pore complex protein Nup58 isoform X2 [Aethina tumida]|uniref:nuclear pore complex protein Nup58 isoform X2 n=1 Tax=Aethina tumida TaxID=116153 RepID=UPI0021488E52|nr:nuclear pore complex protein Nup58 isoform X2 [Aethina tumida]